MANKNNPSILIQPLYLPLLTIRLNSSSSSIAFGTSKSQRYLPATATLMVWHPVVLDGDQLPG